jgi:hypothetical protein
VDVTATSEFTAEERNLLVRLPRWVAGAAAAAHPENAGRTRQKVDQGFLAVGNGRRSDSPLVAEIAAATLKIYDEDPKASGIDPTTSEGAELTVQYALTAVTILRTKAERAEASAYRRWLIGIVDNVVTGVRHAVLGYGGVEVHPKEREFRERLATITRSPRQVGE